MTEHKVVGMGENIKLMYEFICNLYLKSLFHKKIRLKVSYLILLKYTTDLCFVLPEMKKKRTYRYVGDNKSIVLFVGSL